MNTSNPSAATDIARQRDHCASDAARAPRRIAYYLRHCGSLHYFASLRPYLDHFLRQGVHRNALVVRDLTPGFESIPEYQGYAHLFTADRDLDAYDLVLTPTHLRDDEIVSRARVVQIFHGMSDKPFTYERDFSEYRLCLCAGQRQVDRLTSHEPNRRARIAMIGYPKFDRVANCPRLFDNGKKTVIYAPTWRKENLSSIEIFLDNPATSAAIAADYNLIVKPHPNIFDRQRAHYDRGMVERLEQTPGIALVRSGNVMPWFAQADIFVGDISASCYEWLYFARPMVFLNPRPALLKPSRDVDTLTYLWQCGDVCDDVRDLKLCIDRSVENDRYRAAREAALEYSVFEPHAGGATQRGIEHIEALLCC